MYVVSQAQRTPLAAKACGHRPTSAGAHFICADAPFQRAQCCTDNAPASLPFHACEHPFIVCSVWKEEATEGITRNLSSASEVIAIVALFLQRSC